MLKIGRAKKSNGVWILEPYGIKNFAIRGKHPATVCIAEWKTLNVYLCLAYGDLFVEFSKKLTRKI